MSTLNINRHMVKRIIPLLVLLFLGISATEAQLLYKISGNHLSKPSYIVGTHHLTDASFVKQIPGVDEAMNATVQVCGELPFDNLFNPDTLKAMTEAMTLPEGQTLYTVFTAEQMKLIDASVKKYFGVGLDNPTVKAQVEKLTPSALSQQLTTMMYLKAHPGGFNPMEGIDNYFQKEAKKAGKPVLGLETCAFQINALLKSQTVRRQGELLMCLINNEDKALKQITDMTEAYHNQNLNKLKEIMDEEMGGDCDSTPEEKARLFDNRNRDWLTKMPAIMQQPTLFVVGAGHLAGPNGILKGLQQQGYTVTPMK